MLRVLQKNKLRDVGSVVSTNCKFFLWFIYFLSCAADEPDEQGVPLEQHTAIECLDKQVFESQMG